MVVILKLIKKKFKRWNISDKKDKELSKENKKELKEQFRSELFFG
jgi:hypothetical protein